MTTPLHGFPDQPAQRAHVRKAKSRGLSGAIGRADRPTTRRRARSFAGLRSSSPSRTASSSTSTRAAVVFLTVERPYAASHSSIARSINPADIIDTGRCPAPQHAFSQSRRVRIQRRRGIDPASPPISQLGDIVSEWLTGVDTRSGGTLQTLDPGARLFERSVRTLYALTVMRPWMRPPHPRVVGRSSSTLRACTSTVKRTPSGGIGSSVLTRCCRERSPRSMPPRR